MSVPSPDYEARTLVLCFDGTANSFDDENTNIVRLFSALEKRRADKQLCYYQPGIGTYVAPTAVWFTRKLAEIADEAVAWYLDAHIMGGYRFLMENYTKGDKICLFGFSRGAYTARCLAGMLHKVGLLPKSNEEQIPFAYKKYTDTSDAGKIRAKGFKAAFSTVVDIEFVGVWDTVASVGLFSRHLPFTASNTIIKTFRQALALDEHRAKFKPNPWHHPAPTAEAARRDPDSGTSIKRPRSQGNVIQNFIHRLEDHSPLRQETAFSVDLEAIDHGQDDDDDNYREEITNVKEVWFAGCHADVGGGSVSNNINNTLANPSLKWMINELIEARTGIIFKEGAFSDIPAFEVLTITLADPTPRDRLRIPSQFRGRDKSVSEATAVSDAGGLTTSPTTATSANFALSATSMVDTDKSVAGSTNIPEITTSSVSPVGTEKGAGTHGAAVAPEPGVMKIGAQLVPESVDQGETIVSVMEEHAALDATAPMYDQLVQAPAWWILELIPTWEHFQDSRGHWHRGFWWNLGRPRNIQQLNPVFHSSVKLRESGPHRYRPRAKYMGQPTYVD